DAEGVVWAVHDEAGRLRDCSPNLPDDDPLRRPSEDPPGTDAAGRPRRVLSRTVPEDGPVAVPPENQGRKPARLTGAGAAPTEPVAATLRALATALTGVSAAVWLLAFVVGRRLCRRALRPLSDMTEAARAVGPEERDRRLPVSAAGDEL